MKLRYLFLAAMVACVLPSCSDDNNNGIELPDDTMVEANISLIAAPQGETMTKAAPDEGTDGERFIGKLTAYVFYENDSFAGMGVEESVNNVSVSEIKNIVIKVKAKGKGQLSEPTKLKMVLLANTSLGKTPATLSDLTGDASFSGIAALNGANASLPMYSPVVEINAQILAGSDYNNWVLAKTAGIQYTDQGKQKLEGSGDSWAGTGVAYEETNDDRIELTRHVARVQLESLRADFKDNYNGASFTLKKVYLANASDNSKFFTDGSAYGLEKVDGFLHGCDYQRDDYFLVGGTNSVASLMKDYGVGLEVKNNVSPSFADHKAQFYAFELGNENLMRADVGTGTITVPAGRKINTMLVLEGTWKYATGNKTDTRYYRIPVRATEGGNEPGVIHNTIYKISATLTGEGSTDPDTENLNACISFQVKVEDWKVIYQTEND